MKNESPINMLQRTKLSVQECKSLSVYCSPCRCPIALKEIQVAWTTYADYEILYHLNCFIPKFDQYIHESDVEYILSSSNLEKFNKWLSNWNSKYHMTFIPSIVEKLIDSTASKNRRSLIEIFKYLDPIEILTNLAYVNKTFYHTSWEPELWRYFVVQDFKSNAESLNYRVLYMNYYISRCIECKDESTSNVESYRCVLLNKIICKNCRKIQKYKLISKSQVREKYGIDPNKLDLRFGYKSWKVRAAYQVCVEKAVQKFREESKNKLRQSLMKYLPTDHVIFGVIEGISTKCMNKDERHSSDVKIFIDCDLFQTIYCIICYGNKKIKLRQLMKLKKNKFN